MWTEQTDPDSDVVRFTDPFPGNQSENNRPTEHCLRVELIDSRHEIRIKTQGQTFCPMTVDSVYVQTSLQDRTQTYMQTLVRKGFVEETPQDGGKLYRVSRKGFDLIRDEKLTQFVAELP